MTKDELRSFGTMDLGKLAAEKINLYHQSCNEDDINDLFYLLNEIARRVIYSNYQGVENHLLDDTIAQISEDVLMLIFKSPEKYINHSNFFYYFKSAIRKRASSTLTDLYRLTQNIESLDDPDSTGRVKLYPSGDDRRDHQSHSRDGS